MNKMKNTPKEVHRREKGQSLVELAVSFTLVMFVLSGAVDFGRAFFDVIALRDAAQEGVLYASINPTDESGIRDRVKQSSDSPIDFSAFPDADIDISNTGFQCAGFYDDGGTLKSYWIKVTLYYDFSFSMPLIQNIFSDGITLTVDDTHTILAPQCP